MGYNDFEDWENASSQGSSNLNGNSEFPFDETEGNPNNPRYQSNESDDLDSEDKQLSKKQMFFISVGALLVFSLLAFGFYKLTSVKPKTDKTEPKTEQTVSSSSVVKKSSSKSSSKVESSTNRLESDSSKTEAQSSNTEEYYKVGNLSKEVLSNEATIKSIKLAKENDKLALFHVELEMGATTLTLALNHDQAVGMGVGDKVKVNYSKVEGADKVVIRSIERLETSNNS